MKRIQLKSKPNSSEGSEFLNVLRDRGKKNTQSLLTQYPNLGKILLVGGVAAVLCLLVFYLADPQLAGEWSVGALGLLSLNSTGFRSVTRNSILHYATWLDFAASNATSSPSSAHHRKPPEYVPFNQTIREGYRQGLVQHKDNFEFVWMPATARSVKNPQGGIVFIAHACKRLPIEWFPMSEFCPTCRPLPIQESITTALRQHGYSVVVVAPVENLNKCWHQNDRKFVGLAVQYVLEATFGPDNRNIPMYAIGIENGGVFLGNSAESLGNTYRTKFSAMALMNAGIWHMNMKANQFPAVMFIDLARNGELCNHNNLTMYGIRAKDIPAVQYYSDPRPVSPDYFVSIMSLQQSQALHGELKEAGLIWPASHVLLKDPTLERYRYEIIEVLFCVF